MRNLKPPVTRTPVSHSKLDPKLEICTHVFVKNENRKGLAPNYKGPYKILNRNPKYFSIEINGKPDNVSIDRLKCANLELDSEKPEETYISNRNRIVTEDNPLSSIPNNPQISSPNTEIASRNVTRIRSPRVRFEQPAPSTTTTRSGRVVKKPNRYGRD